MTTPATIIAQAHNLENEPFVLLFELTDTDGAIVRMSPVGEIVWMGKTFEEIPCALSDAGKQSNDKKNRPRFSVVNPEGIFTSAVDQRSLEGATLIRYQLLKSDLTAGDDRSLKREMRVSRVLSVTKEIIVLESRGALDGARFKLPYRQYAPPEFPHVRLK